MERSNRYLLLPKWIRFFSWIFLFIGCGVTAIELLGFIFNFGGNLMLFGLQYSGPLRNPTAATFGGVFAFLGYTAYLLLWGKKEGRKAGLASGYIGIALCSLATVAAFIRGTLHIPFEPFFQIPFVIALHRLRGRWEEEHNQAPLPTPVSVTRMALR